MFNDVKRCKVWGEMSLFNTTLMGVQLYMAFSEGILTVIDETKNPHFLPPSKATFCVFILEKLIQMCAVKFIPLNCISHILLNVHR